MVTLYNHTRMEDFKFIFSGQTVAKMGDVLPVKILGTIALIDEGETDWKLLAIDTRDPMASQVNDIEDVESLMPGLIEATVEWFKIYKMPQGENGYNYHVG